MSDKPIIFSGPMVRALLDGRKHQTRRILKPQPDSALPIGGADFVVMPGERGSWCWLNGWDGSIIDRFRVPYSPGDRLYVREAFATDGPLVRYYATDDVHELRRKKSPIHMPRWASRLTLTVTDVRVQRLQEISEEDADAEGFGGHFPHEVLPEFFPEAAGHLTIPECFARIWNSLHGPDAWAANPWVAALTFTVEQRNIDEVRP